LDGVALVLKEAMDAEDEARRVVLGVRETVMSEVRAATEARRAAGAYRAPDAPPPSRLDLTQ
jgi:hypothetical protein